MKTILALTGLCLLLQGLTAAAQSGGGYELTGGFASGSGPATNGAYRLTGTFSSLAVNLAATSSGYSLTGGFASAVVVQTPGAPLLKITRSGANLVLSWPDPSTGFKLQSTPGLVVPSWTDVAQSAIVVGGDKSVTVSAAGGSQFYRLFKP